MTTTTDPGTTPPEIAPPGMAMAQSPPELEPQNALIDGPEINYANLHNQYAELHNAPLRHGPPVTTGSRTLDRSLHLAPCRVCGGSDALLTIWYDYERETVCGECFAWACQAMQTIKVQKFYV